MGSREEPAAKPKRYASSAATATATARATVSFRRRRLNGLHLLVEVVNSCFLAGGYGTESHGHLLGHGHGHRHGEHRPANPPVVPEAEPEAA